MAQKRTTKIVFADCHGGRNAVDPPELLPENQVVEAFNVDFSRGRMGNKRGGSTLIGMLTGGGGAAFTGKVTSLIRYVPGADESAAELWAIPQDDEPYGRLTGGTTWSQVDAWDTPSNLRCDATGAGLGGLLHFGANSDVNRLHVFDVDYSTTTLRRSGMLPSAAPTGADMGAGGLSFTRIYRQRLVLIVGSSTRCISEPSATLSHAIAAKLGVTITKAATPSGEVPTHWDLEAADTTAGPFYRIARTAIGTATFNDTSATISTTTLSATEGINVPPPSAKWVVRDGNRLVMTGAWETSAASGETTPKNNRIWWTPVLGSTDIGDSERVLSTAFLDVETATTGLGVLGGEVYVFSYRSIYKLVRTGLASTPYVRENVADYIGAVKHQTIANGEDENGNPCLYFLSHKGPYRLGVNGLQYLGHDVDDQWALANLAATTNFAHGVYHAEKHQMWFFVGLNGVNTPQYRLVFHVHLGRPVSGGDVRGGWALYGGPNANCSVLFSNTLGASMSLDLKPYIGGGENSGDTNSIWKLDSSATTDNGTAFQAYVDTRVVTPAGHGRFFGITNDSYLAAKVASGVTITVTANEDFGARSNASGTALLTAAGTETRVIERLEGLQTAQCQAVSFRIGDASAVSNQWTLDALTVDVVVQD